MKRVGAWVILFVAAAGLVVGLGAMERTDTGERLRDWFIWGPQEEQESRYTTTIIFDTIAQAATVNGERFDMSWGSYAQTGYSDDFTASGTVSIFGLEEYAPVHDFELAFDGTSASIEASFDGSVTRDDVTYHQYSFAYGPDDTVVEFEVPGDGAWHDFAWSLRVPAVLNTRNGANDIIGEKGATHAKESEAQDQFITDTDDDVYLSWDGTEYATDGFGLAASGRLNVGAGLRSDSMHNDVLHDLDLLKITVEFNGAEIDASQLQDVEIDAQSPNVSYTGEPMYLNGSGNTLTWSVEDAVGTADEINWSGWVDPLIVHKGCPPLLNMDNAEHDTLLVYNAAAEQYNATTSVWEDIGSTLSDWQGTTITPDWGIYSWDADPPPDGAIRTLAATSFYIDKDDAQDKGEDGSSPEGSGTSPAFDHDLIIPISGWVLSAEDREATPYVETIASIAHNGTVDLYGPADALGHDDFTGSGSVTSPNAAGSFSVSGSGSLAVNLPNNFEDRLAEVSSENFPTGMPGVPQVYWYHKADVWADYDGEPDQSGGTWSEPAEAVFCGRGFPCLKLTFPTYAADDELTVTLVGKTFTITQDTHKSDASRQQDFEYDPSPFSYEYTCQLTDGVGYIYLVAPNDGTRDPDLEVVESITIEGFSDGSWVIAEPQWCADPAGTTEQVKFFEHWQYKDGGLSAVADSTSLNALMDSTEGNSGHDNTVETRTVRIFDYVVGATSGIDITSAKSLEAMMTSVTNACDAWTGTYTTAAAEAAFKDADDNWLKTPSATDICPQVKTNVGSLKVACRVWQWTCVGGLTYDWTQTVGDIKQGSMHGPMLDSDDNLLRSDTGESVYREPADGSEDPELHDTPTSDSAGYWRAASGEIYYEHDPSSVLWTYGIGEDSENITSTGRWATREYDFYEIELPSEIGGRLAIPLIYLSGRMLHFYSHGNGIEHIWSSPEWWYWSQPDWVDPGYDNPHTDTSNSVDDHPSAVYTMNGRTHLFWVREGSIYHSYSDDMGETWSSEVVMLSGYDRGFLWDDRHGASPRIHFVGIKSDGTVEYACSFDGAETFTTAVQVATGAEVRQPTGLTAISGKLLILFNDGTEEVLYSSDDGGQTWSNAEA